VHIGQPVAWCIADGASGEVVSAFLSCIHKNSPQTQVQVIMTDDGNQLAICDPP
jgi:hypothetical protein